VRARLRPALLAEAVWKVDLQALWARGIRGIILDLDNTIAHWRGDEAVPEARVWIEAAQGRGFRLCLVSNASSARRLRRVAEDLEIGQVGIAAKPFPAAFRRAMAVMGTTPAATCAIGDQVFTDMLGANWLGLTTILVEPISPRESPHTRLVRLLERPLRRRWCSWMARESRPEGPPRRMESAAGDPQKTPRA